MTDNVYAEARRQKGWRRLDEIGLMFQRELYAARDEYGLEDYDFQTWGMDFAEDMNWVSSSYEC